MRHTLIRRFTADTNKLRRRDADGEDPDERLVPVDGPLAAVDVLTDASQYTQEKRAAPGQEDFGILKPMRLPNGSYMVKVFWLIIIGASVPSTKPGQRIVCFPSHLDNLSQPVSTLLPHLDDRSLFHRHLITTSLRNGHPVSSSFSICMDRIWFWKGGKRAVRPYCTYTASKLVPSRGDSGRSFYDTSFYCKYLGTVHILEKEEV